MKLSTLAIATAIGAMCASSSAFAAKGGNNNDIVDDELSRRGPDSTSGSGDTVEANCYGATEIGTGYGSGATGRLVIAQSSDGESTVEVEIQDAVPDTHFTVWMRIKGGAGFNSLGSPGPVVVQHHCAQAQNLMS
jgi:hypothetical protein